MQKLFGAVGIVGVLVVAGIILTTSGVNPSVGAIAVNAGIGIGIILGILGIFGVVITMAKRF
ncbi:MAG TPA: hypothetical protein PLI99_01045 [archaeon]|nr:hypothetical protein [archaeon]